MEEKIYKRWAYTENQDEKARINMEIYNRLKPLSKRVVINPATKKPDWTKEDEKQYFCYRFIGQSLGCARYRVVSNPHGFSADEMALVCDGGNLCFGYSGSYDIFIYTD